MKSRSLVQNQIIPLGLVLTSIMILIMSGCVSLEVGLEPLPTPSRTPERSSTPTMPFPPPGPDYRSGVEVYGWLGRVYSLGITNPFEDVLSLEPQGTGIVGLEGIDDSVDSQILALRDTGKLANFWGTLTCGVDDFNGCRFLVKRVRPEGPGPFFEMDRVDGWYGLIIGSITGTDYDNAFVLAGDYSVEYGVGSSINLIEEAIKSLENTNTRVRIWGQMICGVPDAGNCHIYVTDINILTESNPSRPTETPFVLRSNIQPDSTWLDYSRELLGIHFRYPTNARVVVLPAVYLPPRKQPESESDEEILDLINRRFGNTLCIEIYYESGFIFISPPANRGDKYVDCSMQGLPVGEIINKSESTIIDGVYISFNGIEIAGTGYTLDQHNETFAAILPNGYTIQYGTNQDPNTTYASYLLTTKQVLLAILSTMTFTPR